MFLHKAERVETFKEKLKISLAAPFLLSLTLFFFGPFTIYYTNITEMPFLFSQVCYFFLSMVLVVGLILSLILWGLKGSAHITASALIFALGFLFWFQGNVLVWNYGPLDGHQIIFENYFWNGVIDSLTWIIILTAALLYSKKIYRHIALICSLLIISQAAGFTIAEYSAPSESNKNFQYSSDHKKMYEFSTNRNVIIIVLDAFQSDIFQKMIDEDQEYSNMFDGFIYYRNNVAGFTYTEPSIMYILSGKLYDNSVPFSQFISDTSLHNSLPLILKENGIRVDIKPLVINTILFDNKVYDTIDGFSLEPYIQGTAILSVQNVWEIIPLCRLTFFRFVPQALKRYSYYPGKRIDMITIRDNDLDVYSRFNSAIQVSEPRRVFKLFHLIGAHVPYTLSENLSYEELPQNITGYKSQAKASLRISHSLLESLKRNSSYDNSLIFIIGDHGSGVTANGPSSGHLPSRGIPLMLVKPFNSTGKLAISDSPVTIGDIPKTIVDELEINASLPGSSIFSVNETDSRVRSFYSYNSFQHDNNYLAPLMDYKITGFSWNPSSWKSTHYEYTSDGVKYVPFESEADMIEDPA